MARLGAALAALVLLGCGGDNVRDIELGTWGTDHGICAKPTIIEQPYEREVYDCWRVIVPDGTGVTEVGEDCQGAPRCLVTPSRAIEHQVLDWGFDGEGNPTWWLEVPCEERCEPDEPSGAPP
jgi:hypothetical protein